jgi:glycosyltransferase involved in cell wall biosynthesis
LPSYYPVEAQPVSIIEAMNAGNAIISTLHASIPEYVDDKKLGLLVEKRNTQQLANAIISICNPEILSVYSLNARKKFQNNFSDAVITEKLNSIFN